MNELLLSLVHVRLCSEKLRLSLRAVEKTRSCFDEDIHCQQSESLPNNQLRELEYEMGKQLEGHIQYYALFPFNQAVVSSPAGRRGLAEFCTKEVLRFKGCIATYAYSVSLEHRIYCSCLFHGCQYTQAMGLGLGYTHQIAIQ